MYTTVWGFWLDRNQTIYLAGCFNGDTETAPWKITAGANSIPQQGQHQMH